MRRSNDLRSVREAQGIPARTLGEMAGRWSLPTLWWRAWPIHDVRGMSEKGFS